jgi:hypothetical protein
MISCTLIYKKECDLNECRPTAWPGRAADAIENSATLDLVQRIVHGCPSSLSNRNPLDGKTALMKAIAASAGAGEPAVKKMNGCSNPLIRI